MGSIWLMTLPEIHEAVSLVGPTTTTTCAQIIHHVVIGINTAWTSLMLCTSDTVCDREATAISGLVLVFDV